MTKEDIKKMPKIIYLMFDESILADSRTKVREKLEEVCGLAIKALEQESALDNVRTEIAKYKDDAIIHMERNETIDMVLEIIDKYRTESESEDD